MTIWVIAMCPKLWDLIYDQPVHAEGVCYELPVPPPRLRFPTIWVYETTGCSIAKKLGATCKRQFQTTIQSKSFCTAGRDLEHLEFE